MPRDPIVSRLTIDGDAVRQARLTSGSSRAELANISGIGSAALARIEANSERTSRLMTLEKLDRLATGISLDPIALLRKPEGRPPEVATGGDPVDGEADDDAARLIAALAAAAQPLRPSSVLAVFGWTHDRLDDTVARANRSLVPLTVHITTGPRGLRLQPRHVSGHDDAARVLANVASIEGYDSSYLKVLYRFWAGTTMGAAPGNRSRATLAVLIRLGLLQNDRGGLTYRTTDAFRFAFPSTGDDESRAG